MVKRDIASIIILSVSNLIWICNLLLSGVGLGYLYPTFTFQWQAFLFLFAAMLIADAIIIAIYFLFRRSIRGFITTLILFLIIWWFVFMLCALLWGVCWSSQINQYSSSFQPDDSFDKSARIGGLRISDILNKATSSNGEFYYYYRSVLFCSQFSFRGEFAFGEEDYKSIIAYLDNAPEFETIYDESKQVGHVEIVVDVPAWESKTTVDRWDSFVIVFSDVDNTICFNLSGEYST